MISLPDIAPSFLFIVGKGFAQTTAVYNPQEFGNASLVMRGAPFSLRFERDRGQVTVDVGNDSSGWQKLEDVIEFVDNSVTQGALGAPPKLDVMARLLEQHWNTIAKLFVDSQEFSRFRTFAKQKAAHLLGTIFPNKPFGSEK